jgi:RNA polymerase sigma-70 factor, ECF subfamily
MPKLAQRWVAPLAPLATVATVASIDDGRGSARNTRDPDADICALIERGEKARAIERMMQRFGDEVYRYCLTSLGEGHADDALQEVFIGAHRDLHTFSGRSPLRCWLFAIVRHRVIDARRVNERKRLRSAALSNRAIDPSSPAGERLDQARLVQALRGCLTELGEHIREAVLLRYQQGFSYEEMAGLLDEKSRTLQARVVRSLRVLHECIERRTGGAV